MAPASGAMRRGPCQRQFLVLKSQEPDLFQAIIVASLQRLHSREESLPGDSRPRDSRPAPDPGTPSAKLHLVVGTQNFNWGCRSLTVGGEKESKFSSPVATDGWASDLLQKCWAPKSGPP